MLFNSLEYAVFFIVVYGVYWTTVRHARVALGFLLFASLLFYACWNPTYLVLIVASSVVDFLVGGRLFRTADPRRRKRLLAASLVYNLGVLATFKYFNFFAGSMDELVRWLGAESWFTAFGTYLPGARLDFLLPVGISFFTFQSMSYTIDIYRRQLEPVRSFPRYLLFVSFFPQLVAGPIVRAREFLPQLAARPPVTDTMGGRGLFLIGLGLFKKVVVADFLALNLVDRVFATPAGFSSLETLVGVYGYAFQIYCDFSGYSDIAIGSALLLGFRFPDNFNGPYKAHNLQDFWHRWHISLSSWLRDYLYISLGGNRGAAWKTYRNLLLTMLLGGLWHGAGWNFIIWGALHGGALAVLRAWQRRRERIGVRTITFRFFAKKRNVIVLTPIRRVLAAVLTFHYVCFAWIFFRAADFSGAAAVLEALVRGDWGVANLDPRVLLVLGVAAVTHFWPRRWFERLVEGFVTLPAAVQAAAMVAVGLGLREVAVSDVVPFIYFQF